MKAVRVSVITQFNFCKSGLGEFDCPTIYGPWANICEQCLPQVTTPLLMSMGFRKILI